MPGEPSRKLGTMASSPTLPPSNQRNQSHSQLVLAVETVCKESYELNLDDLIKYLHDEVGENARLTNAVSKRAAEWVRSQDNPSENKSRQGSQPPRQFRAIVRPGGSARPVTPVGRPILPSLSSLDLPSSRPGKRPGSPASPTRRERHAKRLRKMSKFPADNGSAIADAGSDLDEIIVEHAEDDAEDNAEQEDSELEKSMTDCATKLESAQNEYQCYSKRLVEAQSTLDGINNDTATTTIETATKEAEAASENSTDKQAALTSMRNLVEIHGAHLPNLADTVRGLEIAATAAAAAANIAAENLVKVKESLKKQEQARENAQQLIDSLHDFISIEKVKIEAYEHDYEVHSLQQTIEHIGFAGLRLIPKDKLVETRKMIASFRRASMDAQ
ncbi:hypothetical protein ACHAP5_011811 [Fusarium lateritium]